YRRGGRARPRRLARRPFSRRRAPARSFTAAGLHRRAPARRRARRCARTCALHPNRAAAFALTPLARRPDRDLALDYTGIVSAQAMRQKSAKKRDPERPAFEIVAVAASACGLNAL